MTAMSERLSPRSLLFVPADRAGELLQKAERSIADGVIVHNSIEQDADVVLFLYRDEAYNPESDQRGVVEILVAKHRNGPTGTARVAFLDHYVKFANMARE